MAGAGRRSSGALWLVQRTPDRQLNYAHIYARKIERVSLLFHFIIRIKKVPDEVGKRFECLKIENRRSKTFSLAPAGASA